KGTAFRLVHTLAECGFLERTGTNGYRCPLSLRERGRYRIGFAAGGDNTMFNREVTDGLVQAAANAGLELIVEDNRYSRKHALRVIDQLLKQHVDLIIEYQSDYSVAPVIAAKCAAQDVPLIAVDVPHPGAVYFGANHYEAGLIGGRHLAKWAKARWDGQLDEVILVEQRRAGPLPQARLSGSLAGIIEVLPQAQQCRVVHLEGDGDMGRSIAEVRRHLRFNKPNHVLVAGLDDISALGALRAFEECGRVENCAVMGQNAASEARSELRRKGTRLIGSVGYFPEKYGPALVRTALEILKKNTKVRPAFFVKHVLITPENVDRYYPNDALLGYT
ncbi:MAG TPA: substrate-binding domain-containing protein, partial [Bryobacteraceae bacterium]|nr:substrate-binding domain-containing protein [Bryobacteraceae bacterium]